MTRFFAASFLSAAMLVCLGCGDPAGDSVQSTEAGNLSGDVITPQNEILGDDELDMPINGPDGQPMDQDVAPERASVTAGR